MFEISMVFLFEMRFLLVIPKSIVFIKHQAQSSFKSLFILISNISELFPRREERYNSQKHSPAQGNFTQGLIYKNYE